MPRGELIVQGQGRVAGRALGGETGGSVAEEGPEVWKQGATKQRGRAGARARVWFGRSVGLEKGSVGTRLGEGSKASKLECLSGLGYDHEASGEPLWG